MMERRHKGSGMMGRGGTYPDMEGSGVMAPTMMGRDRMGRSLTVMPNMDLSVDDVRHFLKHHLDWHGNKRLKVGDVKEIDDDSIAADIVTTEGALVDRFEIDRHSGQMDRID